MFQKGGIVGLLTALLAGCATAGVEAQYLRYRSWAAFKASPERQFTVKCGPYRASTAEQRTAAQQRKAACVRNFEMRGYVRIARPTTRFMAR